MIQELDILNDFRFFYPLFLFSHGLTKRLKDLACEVVYAWNGSSILGVFVLFCEATKGNQKTWSTALGASATEH